MKRLPDERVPVADSSGEPRVAVVAACPLPARRGTPVRIFRIAEALHELGCAVHVVAYHLGEKEPRAPFPIHRIEPVGWYTRFAPGPSYGKLLVDLRLCVRLRQVLISEQIDVIHAHHYEGMLCALHANRGLNLPIMFDVHTLLESELPSYNLGLPGFFKIFIGRRFDDWLPRYASHVIAVSDVIRRKLVAESGLPAEKVSLIPNGTELTAVRRTAEENARPIVLFTGNLAAYQDVDVLLDAFAMLKQRVPAPLLRVVTDDDVTHYKALAQRLGISAAVEFVRGTLSDLPGHLASAAVAVNPRRVCAGLPQKLLNYMAAGCPIVTFRGSARHVVHMESAWIAQNDTAASLAQGIDHLLDHPQVAQRLAATAAACAKRQLGWNRAAAEVYGLCCRLAAAQPRPRLA